MRFSTRAIHIGQEPNLKEGGSGDVVVPIHMSSTFARRDPAVPTGGYEYSRTGNPTRTALEAALASLEGARYGLAFASGLAATDTVLKLLKKGDHVVAFDDLYGGTRRLFTRVWEPFGIEFSFVDARSTDAVKAAVRPETRMVWLETPTNPLLKLCDIQAVRSMIDMHVGNGSASSQEGLKPSSTSGRVVLVVDNTFASPYFQEPLTLGADIVLHSTTKYLGGHSDVVGGAVMLSDEALHEQLKFLQNAAGAIPSPFDSWLVLRGLKTLALRMERHAASAQKIAEWLEKHPGVERVIYPGLASHPQHELSLRQMSGMGGMITFFVKGGLEKASRFLGAVKIFALAESLGGVESLIEHPALMTHASVPPHVRKELGISDTLIRLSVGIEDVEDLIADLDQALAVI